MKHTLLFLLAFFCALAVSESQSTESSLIRSATRSLQDTVEEDNHDEDMDHHEDDGNDHGSEEASPATISSDKPWGEAIGAALIVNSATLIGLLILIPTLLGGRFFKSNERDNCLVHWFLYTLIPSFAAGALLATTVFLIIPESILLIGNETGATEHDHRHLEENNAEGQLAWKFGTSFLGGFLLPTLLGSLFPHAHENEAPQQACPVCEQLDSIQLEHVDEAVVVNDSRGNVLTCDDGACQKTYHHHEESDEEVWDRPSCSTCHEELVAKADEGTSEVPSRAFKDLQQVLTHYNHSALSLLRDYNANEAEEEEANQLPFGHFALDGRFLSQLRRWHFPGHCLFALYSKRRLGHCSSHHLS